MATKNTQPKETTLDEDVTTPSTTAPGDGPADTTDPKETAHSVPTRPGAEAIQAGTVNAVIPGVPVDEVEVDEKDHRIETYEATKPDGTVVKVTHNLETGETSVS